MNIIESEVLEGYSGCRIYKFNNNNKFIVKKISKNLKYNKRFINQIAKQEWFYDNINFIERIKTPKIFNKYENKENLFECNMEYIKGESIINHIYDKIYIDKIFWLLTLYFKAISNIEKIDEHDDNLSTCLNKKIDQLIKLKNIPNSIKLNFIEATKKVTKVNLKSTFCHGDFTLENIIYDNKNKLYLIDFLDSFYSHYWIDISKLYQDIEAGWYFIKNDEKEPEDFINNYLKLKLDEYLKKEFPDYCIYHYYFLALNLARIIPYTQDYKIRGRLICKIAKYINYFLNNKKLGENEY